MKDWKTYALVIIALWCAYLTWRTTPSVVWSAHYEQEYGGDKPIYWWWGRNYHREPPATPSVDHSLRLRALVDEVRRARPKAGR